MYIATAEGDQPRVRAFAMWFCDNTGFYYHTGTPKKIFGQLKKNLATAPKGGEVAIFRVTHGEAYFWTMANNMRESDVPRLKF